MAHSKVGYHRILNTPFKGPYPESSEYIIVATGCFWGSEKSFWRLPGVFTTAVGYAGGKPKVTTYEKVCSGSTGHTEAVLVVWDPAQLSLADITRMFLQSHDPSQVDGQGNDRGTQYRSAFYFHTDDQRKVGESAIATFEKQIGKKIATEVKKVSIEDFVFAEDYHQQYLAAPGARKYCSATPLGINLEPDGQWLPEELKKSFATKLPEAFWKKHGPTFHCTLNDPHDPITSW